MENNELHDNHLSSSDILYIGKIPVFLIKKVIEKADSIVRFSRLSKGMLEICEGVTTKYEIPKNFCDEEQRVAVYYSFKTYSFEIYVSGAPNSHIFALLPEELKGFRKTAKFYYFEWVHLAKYPVSLTKDHILMLNTRITDFFMGLKLTCDCLSLDQSMPYLNSINLLFNFRMIKFQGLPNFNEALLGEMNDVVDEAYELEVGWNGEEMQLLFGQ